ncbi:hypothetical protein [Rhodoferax sp.]|uniref:hypothetical protein n=1 Tax=Rhodoferax sp. TaxID=50421 RepID=UPI002761C604|nr:hypothetical protein [Rhodoferax sp.]
MDEATLALSIRLRHPTMNVRDISRGMEFVPVVAHQVGDVKTNRAGQALGGRYAESYWVCRPIDTESIGLATAIAMANQWMSARAVFVTSFGESGGAAEYYLTAYCTGLFGFELDPQLLHQCAALRVKLAVEVISASDE